MGNPTNPPSSKRSLPRRRRALNPPRIERTARDEAVIAAVSAYRVLRTDQLQALFFPSARTAQRVLARLFHHGYLERQFLPTVYGGLRQAVYLLDGRGADLLAAQSGLDRGELDGRVPQNLQSDLFLAHTLCVNDVRVAVEVAARQRGWRVERWLDEAALKALQEEVEVRWTDGRGVLRRRRVGLAPDGYCLLDVGKRAHCFVEVDQGTETNRRWAGKVRAYLAYWQSGQYRQRYQTSSLRVLTVTAGAKRLANLKATTEAAGGGAMFWFTTLEQVTAATVLTEAVWQMAGDAGLQALVG